MIVCEILDNVNRELLISLGSIAILVRVYEVKKKNMQIIVDGYTVVLLNVGRLQRIREFELKGSSFTVLYYGILR